MPMVAQAVLLGGNCRVGLEDNLYLRAGELATNAQLVERAVQIIESLDRVSARCLVGGIEEPQQVGVLAE